MTRIILITGFLLSALLNSTSAQSVYFFKTKETLELEKWDAMEASKTSVANAIADELSSRESEQKQIDDLQSQIDQKLKAEDYFAADKLNNELEALKVTQTKAKDIRKNIELALETEDFANAQTLKNQLLDLLQMSSSAQSSSSTASNVDNTQTSVVSAGSGSLQDAFTSTNPNTPPGSASLLSSSSEKTDKYGRTEAKNRKMARNRKIAGSVFLGTGSILLISGLIVTLTAYETGPGIGMCAASAPLIIPGTFILIASKKYKKRADQLANGTASISPSILNVHSYGGATGNSHTGYGLTFNYQF